MVFCVICKINVDRKSYDSHVGGKKHKMCEDRMRQCKQIQDNGLYITDLPPGATTCDIVTAFERFGKLNKVEIYGPPSNRRAFVSVDNMQVRDEVMRHQIYIRDQAVTVCNRVILSGPSNSGVKRGNDGLQKKTPTEAHYHLQLFEALSSPAPFLEQMKLVKVFILAEKEYRKKVQENICKDLNFTFESVFKVCNLYTFGSMITGLAFKGSDLDVYAQLEFNPLTHRYSRGRAPNKPKEIFLKAKGCLYRKPDLFSNIVPIIGAKTPIIKVLHKNTEVSCDISFRDAIGHWNSRLLRHYLNMDERFFDLIFFLKYWACVHKFCSSSKLSNFALCMLAIGFLTSLRGQDGNKVVPSVQDLLLKADPNSPHYVIQEWRCQFDDSPISITLPDSPSFTLLGLLKGFFEYIATFSFEESVVSVLTGSPISKHLFEDSPDELPEAYSSYKHYISKHPAESLIQATHYAVIHDPFKLNHNLLGRVQKPVMLDFIIACRISAQMCSEALENDERSSTLLHQLLNPTLFSKAGVSGSSIGRKPGGKKTIIISLPQGHEEFSFQRVVDLLMNIFEKIFHLKILEKNEGDLVKPSKIMKTEGMQDACSASQITHRCSVKCEGHSPVKGRTKARKKLSIPKGPPNFKIEEKISEFISQHGQETNHLKFQCDVTSQNHKVKLDFKNLLDPQQMEYFTCLMCHFDIHLVDWVKTFYADASTNVSNDISGTSTST